MTPKNTSGVVYEKTMNLRYAYKSIPITQTIGKQELRLQQMSIGSDGSEKWEFIEEVKSEIEKL
jgi:hypothetical protein